MDTYSQDVMDTTTHKQTRRDEHHYTQTNTNDIRRENRIGYHSKIMLLQIIFDISLLYFSNV